MEYLLICLIALFGAGLTLFSGFGLGTLLTPVFALFFPIELAVAMTAIVHLANNLFKLWLVGAAANREAVLRFGIPSVIAAFLGAYLLQELANIPILAYWSYAGFTFKVSYLKICVGLVLIFFALWEVIPYFQNLSINTRYLPIGGLLSGFFGGLTGNQGALRSAFLSKLKLSKTGFVATGVVIACLIDCARLAVYSRNWRDLVGNIDVLFVVLATLSAFVGSYFGNKLLQKVTIRFVQFVVMYMLVLFGVLLMMGVI